MRYFVEVAGHRLVVEITEGRDGEAVTVDGTPVSASLRPVGGASSTFSLLLDGRSHDLVLEPEGESMRVSFAGLGTVVRTRVESERDRHLREVRVAVPSGERTIASVMPGIVSQLLVKPGDAVRAGTPLLVIEAMKMENEVRADGEGVIRAIHVAERARVDVGDALLTIGA